MISAPVEPRHWPGVRLWSAITLVFGLQIALVYRLEDHSPPAPRRSVPAPVLRLTDDPPGGLLAFDDPTLLVLPHREGFSGAAWLGIPVPAFPVRNWAPPMHWLQLDPTRLGAGFKSFVETNVLARFQTIPAPQPELLVPELTRSPPASSPSTVRIEGNLAKRQLLSKFDLPFWTGTDVLTNSVVQVLVGPQGNTFSALLLPAGNGSKSAGQQTADQTALDLARTARFEPVRSSGAVNHRMAMSDMTMGTLIFEWQTLPVPATNAPTVAP
jgi:hypothetical protein